MHNYEIEIKSLLGAEPEKNLFLERLTKLGGTKSGETVAQLNHYFIGGSHAKLGESVNDFFDVPTNERLVTTLALDADFSIRSREVLGKVKLVVKASIGDGNGANGISRMEFEENVPITMQELDQILLDAGFVYQSKWSRERTEYRIGEVTICLDKNAGYGYVAEFETVVTDITKQDEVKQRLYALMEQLGVSEVDPGRLERMFEYYNNNWQDYYGTNNTFEIK